MLQISFSFAFVIATMIVTIYNELFAKNVKLPFDPPSFFEEEDTTVNEVETELLRHAVQVTEKTE